MLSLIGFAGDDYVILAADSSISSSIICMSEEYDRMLALNNHTLLGFVGETGDSLQLSEYIQGNVSLYKFRNSVELSTDAMSHYIRSIMAESIRKSPYEVNMLLGGIDEGKASLYYIDYLGTLQKIPYGAQGYCAYFVLSVFDSHYKKGMTQAEAIDLMKMAIKQVQKRFTINPHGFMMKVIDSKGIRVEPIQ